MKKERPKRKKRWGWLIPAGIFTLLIAFALVVIIADAPARQEIAEIEIGQIDFSHLSDGTYTGEYTGKKSNMRNVALEVTVQEGKVTGFTILRGALDKKGNPAELKNGITAQAYLQSALDAKSLQIDAVSGATLTSKTLLKALENALDQAQK